MLAIIIEVIITTNIQKTNVANFKLIGGASIKKGSQLAALVCVVLQIKLCSLLCFVFQHFG